MKNLKRNLLVSVLFLVLAVVTACGTTTTTTTQAQEYTLSFETDGGTEIADVTFKAGDKVTMPADPVKTGWTFRGWFADVNFDEAFVLPEAMPANDVEVYAKWEIELKFETNGGSKVDSFYGQPADVIKMPANPTFGENVFVGWFTDAEFTTPFETRFLPATNTTVYAKWQVMEKGTSYDLLATGNLVDWDSSFEETIDENGLTIKTSNKVSEYAGIIIDEVKFDASAYSVLSLNLVGTKDKQMIVKLEAGGLENWEERVTFTGEEQTVNLLVNGKFGAEAGRKFIIMLNPDVKGELESEVKVVVSSAKLLISKGLEDKLNEAIFFNTNGGSAVAAIVGEKGTEVTKPENPTRPGYEFGGWYADAQFTTAFEFTTMPEGPTTVYAKWDQLNELKLTFNATGGSEVEAMYVAPGANVELPKAPTKNNCLFLGWFTDEACTKAFDNVMPEVPTTVYAKWLNYKEDLSNYGTVDAKFGWTVKTEGDFTVVEENGILTVTEKVGRGYWSELHNDLSAYGTTYGLNVVRVVAKGVAGKEIRFKFNNYWECEYSIYLTEEYKEHVFILPQAIDTSIPVVLWYDKDAEGTGNSFSISEFEISKVGLDVVHDTKVEAMGAWAFAEGQFTQTESNGAYTFTENETRGYWSAVTPNYTGVDAAGLNVLRFVVSGTPGKTLLVKVNDWYEYEKEVILSETPTEYYIYVGAGLDTSKTTFLWFDRDAMGTNGYFTVHEFEFFKAGPNYVSSSKVEAMGAWAFTEGQFTQTEENGAYTFTENETRGYWSAVTPNYTGVEAAGYTVLRFVVSGTAGKTLLVKVNDWYEYEKEVVLSETPTEYYIYVGAGLDTSKTTFLWFDRDAMGTNGYFTVHAFEFYSEEVVEENEEEPVRVVIADYADANNWANSTAYSTVNFDEYTTVTAEGTAVGSYGLNTGKYYTNGENWRIYQSENAQVTITSTKTIAKVIVEYAIKNTGILQVGEVQYESGAEIAVNANTLSFVVGQTGTATNGNIQITAITVLYA